MPKLTAENVSRIIRDCLFTDEEAKDPEVTASMIEVEGIVRNFGLDPVRVEKHREEIIELLKELPENFRVDSKGKGMSFLLACNDRHGNQWGDHKDIEALFVLGMAINKAKNLLPRALWSALPGGMPYFQIDVN